METYDSTNDVLEHCKRVRFWIGWIIDVLEYRQVHHDESKLVEPEKQVFDEFMPLLKVYQFGSDEYKDALARMGEGLKHHYQENPHHPEHWKRGIDGMSLWDLVEMVCDWMASASVKEGHVNLDYLQKRFDISPQLRHIIGNTLWAADMDCINHRVPMEFWPIINFSASAEETKVLSPREALADYAHNAWAGWMIYMFEKSVENDDGTITIPKSLVDRWKRQCSTNYTLLPEQEKESDRIEADRMIAIYKGLDV